MPDTPDLPRGAGEVTPVWLARVLGHETGAVRLERIGEDEGFSGGAVYRLRPDTGESLILKLSPSGPPRHPALDRANAREVAFYAQAAPDLPVPRCLYGASDATTGASVLLLQDLRGHRPGDFVRGLSASEARALTRALARIHAQTWNTADARALPGAGILDEVDFAACWRAYPAALAALLPGVPLPRALCDLGDNLATRGAEVLAPLFDRGPVTRLHRDPHADNVLFAPGGDAVLLDWQFTGRGRGACDLAYALCSSLTPALRRAEEQGLLSLYVSELERRGVTGYGAAEVRADYRRAVLWKLAMSVVATVLFDNATPAKAAWRRADLERLTAFLADHPAVESARA